MRVTEKPSSSYSGAMTPASMELKNERVAETKAGTDVVSALVLSVLAGVFISMGATFMLVVKSDASLPFAATQLLGGFSFALGLFLILAAGAELFTGNCLMVMGPLSGRFSWGRLLASWCVVLLGNLVGSVLAAALVLAADVASALGMGLSTFSRFFTSAAGMSLPAYVRDRRLSRAAALLADEERSITDVALETGFSTASYLILCFRRQYGMTPLAFRRLYAPPKPARTVGSQ